MEHYDVSIQASCHYHAITFQQSMPITLDALCNMFISGTAVSSVYSFPTLYFRRHRGSPALICLSVNHVVIAR
jgi:hypothetical protein